MEEKACMSYDQVILPALTASTHYIGHEPWKQLVECPIKQPRNLRLHVTACVSASWSLAKALLYLLPELKTIIIHCIYLVQVASLSQG